jgi:glycogen debranching enzyme
MPQSALLALPHLVTGDRELDHAWRIALGDLAGNIIPFQDGILNDPAPVLMAGLDYDSPWTRDAAINTWNGAGLLCPTVTRHTLLTVVAREETSQGSDLVIGGQYNQYWDAIIWALGAWSQYLYTGDREFLALAHAVTRNSLARREADEFDPVMGLFRGPACYGDGVAAYPDVYARTGGSSAILDWVNANPDRATPVGYGLPMHALSTNCLYYETYRVLERMAAELAVPADPSWRRKAQALAREIQARFWDSDAGRFRYLVDPFGGSDAQEGLGHCFALLFGIATREQARAVFRTQQTTPAGIPCVWPTFPRYESPDGMRFGRHSGTVWPHIQAFWAEAAARHGQEEAFAFELRQLAAKACRDSHFAELYHPLTGAIYGGAQERGGQIATDWTSYTRQTWSATGYVRVILMGLLGMRFTPEGVRFQPLLPQGISRAELRSLPYHDMSLEIVVAGPKSPGDSGAVVVGCEIDGRAATNAFLPARGSGERRITITLGLRER